MLLRLGMRAPLISGVRLVVKGAILHLLFAARCMIIS